MKIDNVLTELINKENDKIRTFIISNGKSNSTGPKDAFSNNIAFAIFHNIELLINGIAKKDEKIKAIKNISKINYNI